MSIVLNRDIRYLRAFWTTSWKKMGMNLKRYVTLYPKTDGKTKVVYMNLLQYLRGYNQNYPKTWDENMVYIKHCYNT